MSTTGWPEAAGRGPAAVSARRNWLKLAILLLLLAALGWVLTLIVQYCRTGAPFQELPGLLRVTREVRYFDSLYGVSRPLGVAVSNAGDRIYVSESGGERRILVFNRFGEEIASLIPPGSVLAGRVPLYVAVSPENEIYVSDRFNRAIYIWAADGSFVGTFEPQSVPAEDWHPVGLAFDRQGNLYVTDLTPGKHRVMVFDSSGALKLQFGKEGADPGDFWFPNGLAVDGEGRIYVADGNNGRLQVFDAEGRFLSNIGRGFGRGNLALPRGVAVDGDNRLYVADASMHIVNVYDVSGEAPEFLYAFGSYGLGDGQFRFPNGIAVDGSSRFYVTDRENGRVEIWSYQR